MTDFIFAISNCRSKEQNSGPGQFAMFVAMPWALWYQQKPSLVGLLLILFNNFRGGPIVVVGVLELLLREWYLLFRIGPGAINGFGTETGVCTRLTFSELRVRVRLMSFRRSFTSFKMFCNNLVLFGSILK